MDTRIDFALSALVILVIVISHFFMRDRFDDIKLNFFKYLLMVGIADISLDIISTILIIFAIPELRNVTLFITTLFYMFQIIVVYVFFAYIQTLKESMTYKNIMIKLRRWSIFPIAMILIIFGNSFFGYLFSVDLKGTYIHGPYYYGMYIYTVFFAIIAFIDSIYSKENISKPNKKILSEVLMTSLLCVILQALNSNLLLTSFGIGLGIFILFITINNPYEYTDKLTGYFNKTFYSIWFQQQMERRIDHQFIALDLFSLSRINNVYGPAVGDKLIKLSLDEMNKIEGVLDIFRVTSSRFLLLLDKNSLDNVSQKSFEFFTHPIQIDDHEIDFPVHIAEVTSMISFENSENLITYIEYLTSSTEYSNETVLLTMSKESLLGYSRQQEIERYLKRAIEENLLEVYFQPIYSIKKKGFVSVEALSRLKHPVYGFVPPDTFIRLAEKNGSIREMGIVQMKNICEFIIKHPDLLEKINTVKMNLSPLQLLDKDYVDELVNVINGYKIPLHYFQFEITETIATQYNKILKEIIEHLTNYQIGICLDDFGSGYANLNSVMKLPFSVVKLDKSLADGMDKKEMAIFYKSIVSILNNIGYDIISEGIETKEQVELLESWGVDMIQGYYFSKPVSMQEIMKVLG